MDGLVNNKKSQVIAVILISLALISSCKVQAELAESTSEGKPFTIVIERVPEDVLFSIQPQPGDVYHNRVDAFQQAHRLVDLLHTSVADGLLTRSELEVILQLGVNTRASFYNTGDHQLFIYPEKIHILLGNLIDDDWEIAESNLADLTRSLPRRPTFSHAP
jgi:hypothetical protein